MNNKELDFKMIGILFLVLLACLISYAFESHFKKILRIILESNLLKYSIWTLVISLYIAHYFKTRELTGERNQLISATLTPFMDSLFGAVTYGIIITTTLTLMKGIFIQLSFGEEYFRDFSDFDIFSLAIALFFMLWYSLTKIIEDVKDVFWKQSTPKIEFETPIENTVQ